MGDIIRAYAWYSHHPGGAHPPRRAIESILADIEGELRAAGARPVSLLCQRWLAAAFPNRPDQEFLACMAVAIEPGALGRSFASWYQWQHPRWDIASAPPPMIDSRPTIEHAG